MNLIRDRLFPCYLRDGTLQTLRIAEIARPNNPPVSFAWPRDDMCGASVEFCIGVFAVAFCLTSKGKWLETVETPPSQDEVEKLLNKIAFAFDLDVGNNRFMQDGSMAHMSEEEFPAWRIFHESPASNAIKNNHDVFVSRRPDGLVLSWQAAAIALYIAHTYALQGGTGHYSSLRGVGALTTIVKPWPDATLFETILANIPVLDQKEKIGKETYPKIFLWLLANLPTTRAKYPALGMEQFHRLQTFFAVPGSFYLNFEPGQGRACMITGEIVSGPVMTGFRKLHHGVDYRAITYPHHLTPHKIVGRDRQARPEEVNIHGIGWYDVVGYSMATGTDVKSGLKVLTPAVTVSNFVASLGWTNASVRAYGYGVEGNNTVLGFVDASLPLPVADDAILQDAMEACIRAAVGACHHVLEFLMSALVGVMKTSSASARKIRDSEQLEIIRRQYWDRVGPQFNALIYNPCVEAVRAGEEPPREWERGWLKCLGDVALGLFDSTVDFRFVLSRWEGGSRRPRMTAIIQRWRLIERLTRDDVLFNTLGLTPPEAVSRKRKSK